MTTPYVENAKINQCYSRSIKVNALFNGWEHLHKLIDNLSWISTPRYALGMYLFNIWPIQFGSLSEFLLAISPKKLAVLLCSRSALPT